MTDLFTQHGNLQRGQVPALRSSQSVSKNIAIMSDLTKQLHKAIFLPNINCCCSLKVLKENMLRLQSCKYTHLGFGVCGGSRMLRNYLYWPICPNCPMVWLSIFIYVWQENVYLILLQRYAVRKQVRSGLSKYLRHVYNELCNHICTCHAWCYSCIVDIALL